MAGGRMSKGHAGLRVWWVSHSSSYRSERRRRNWRYRRGGRTRPWRPYEKVWGSRVTPSHGTPLGCAVWACARKQTWPNSPAPPRRRRVWRRALLRARSPSAPRPWRRSPSARYLLTSRSQGQSYRGWRGRRTRACGPTRWRSGASSTVPTRSHTRTGGSVRLFWRRGRTGTAREGALRESWELASRLGAEPLRREVEGLARRARIDLTPPGETPPAPSAEDRLGLTPRELEVLGLVAEGRTNPQIAEELFISAKTAGIHVSHILTKLGVSTRVEAATRAQRAGVLRERDPRMDGGAER